MEVIDANYSDEFQEFVCELFEKNGYDATDSSLRIAEAIISKTKKSCSIELQKSILPTEHLGTVLTTIKKAEVKP